jgi:hypothetical protein
MNECQRLAKELEKAFSGEAWHGPSWRELLEGVPAAAAAERPVARAHTIAEIVLHATTWQDVVRRRLDGESPAVSDAEDWPAASAVSEEAAWRTAVARLMDTARALHEKVERFPAERLHERRPGMEQTWYTMIAGELQHTLYHAGQVSLLKKAAAPAPK